MVLIAVKCPVCGGRNITKNGKTENDEQRYMQCKRMREEIIYVNIHTTVVNPAEKQIIDMTSNASGIRDISRNLKISTDKVMST